MDGKLSGRCPEHEWEQSCHPFFHLDSKPEQLNEQHLERTSVG